MCKCLFVDTGILNWRNICMNVLKLIYFYSFNIFHSCYIAQQLVFLMTLHITGGLQ